MQILKNPFYLYILSFAFTISIYLFHWSGLYPKLSSGLIIFFMISFLISFFLGAIIDKYKKIEYQKTIHSRNYKKITTFIVIGFILEFLYNKGIPILQILNNKDYN